MTRLFVTLLIASLPASAQHSSQYRACDHRAKTQTELNACASDEAERVETQLNQVYRKLLSQVASQREAAANIKAAERQWIAYRDAYMIAMYPAQNKLAEYGSIYPMEANLLRAKLTERQLAALNDLLRKYRGTEHSAGDDTADTQDGTLQPRTSQ